MKFVIVDMQGFCIPDFFPKELAIFDGKRLAHFLIRSPKPLFTIQDPSIIAQIKFVQGSVHGLYYGSGDVAYEDLPAILKNHLQNVDVVYVKGSEKWKFLQDIFNESMPLEVVNTEHTVGCPKFEKQPATCLNHSLISQNRKTKCAINNCQTLYSWIISLLPL